MPLRCAEFFQTTHTVPPEPQKIKKLLEKICEENHRRTALSKELIRCYLTELFAYILRNPSIRPQSMYCPGTNAAVETANSYISKNYSNEITLSQLSQKTGFSESYFSKLFKDSTGFGYKEYLLIVRTRAAKSLLTNTYDDLISAIYRRIDYFHAAGCRISDHALDCVPCPKEISPEDIFKKALQGKPLTAEEINAYKASVLCALANLGALSKFIGMLTDSRSFLSYTRHEYFRRILCNLLGTWVENGEFPADFEILGKIVEDICFNNAKEYFWI